MTLYIRKDIPSLDYLDIGRELVQFGFNKSVEYLHEISSKLELTEEQLERRGIPVHRLLLNAPTIGNQTK